MRTDTTIYRPRVRQRQSPRRIALRRAVFLTAVVVLLAVLVGLAFAGSRSTLAAGTTIAGVDVGGLSRERGRRSCCRSAAAARRAHAGHVHGRRAARSRSRPRSSASRPTGGKRVAAAAAEGGGFGPLRGFKRLRARFFGIDVAPPVTPTTPPSATSSARSPIVDRSGVDAKARPPGPRRRGRRGPCRAASSTGPPPPRGRRRALAGFDRGEAVSRSRSRDRAERQAAPT